MINQEMETKSLHGNTFPEAGSQNTGRTLGFVGLGHIGMSRMKIIAEEAGHGPIAVADTCPENRRLAVELSRRVVAYNSFEELLSGGVSDGIVVATPNALHASQCCLAFEKGIPVFCQKPLGRNAAETAAVVGMAKDKNLLLGIDYTYRYSCFSALKPLLDSGVTGTPRAVEMCFHNAYGPDKDWFYRRSLAGGGCLIDLGVHLIDMALWLLEYPRLEVVSSFLSCQGKPLTPEGDEVEDFALVMLKAGGHLPVRLTCSWHSSPGVDAVLYFNLYGTSGGLSFRNIDGSFYDFEAVRLDHARTIPVAADRGEWGAGALGHWRRKLDESGAYDPEISSAVKVAETLDDIYKAGIPAHTAG